MKPRITADVMPAMCDAALAYTAADGVAVAEVNDSIVLERGQLGPPEQVPLEVRLLLGPTGMLVPALGIGRPQ